MLGAAHQDSTPAAGGASPAGKRFFPVNVAKERIIRTITGLRPYRPSGFVVRTESIEGKTIVHNYGHGGGGVTLSWGSGHLAVELALPSNARRMAVLGAGAVGLATARLLQEHGVEVTIYAKDLPPGTTSNIAGAQVFPVTVYAHDSITPAFRAQFVEAARFSYRRYQLMVGDYYGIRWMPNYMMDRVPLPESGLSSQAKPDRRSAARTARSDEGRASLRLSVCAALRHDVYSTGRVSGIDAARISDRRRNGAGARDARYARSAGSAATGDRELHGTRS